MLFMQNFEGDLLPQYSATSQLIWRDYFYTMSIDNANFGQMEDNPACIEIPWSDVKEEKTRTMLECWKNGKTGYPFIDAGMRQLMQVNRWPPALPPPPFVSRRKPQNDCRR